MIFFLNHSATTNIYTLSLHDALPICLLEQVLPRHAIAVRYVDATNLDAIRAALDRKSTRLNSSHEWISYAVFCLKKKSKIFGGGNNLRFYNGTWSIDIGSYSNMKIQR